MKLNDAIAVFKKANIQYESEADVKRAYRLLALQTHPDVIDITSSVNGSLDIDMVQLNKAWKVIKKQLNNALLLLANNPNAKRTDPEFDMPLANSPMPTFTALERLLDETFSIVRSDEYTRLEHAIWPEEIGLSSLDGLYLEKEQLYVRWHGRGQFIIQDISQALDRGKKSVMYHIDAYMSDEPCEILNYLTDIGRQKFDDENPTIKDLWDYFEGKEFQEKAGFTGLPLYESFEVNFNGTRITVGKRETETNGVFSPFRLHKLKRLDKTPKKPNKLHLIRALANGQYRNLRVVSHLTDDYAFDNANNFGRGLIPNPFPLVKKYIEDMSPRVYMGGTASDGITESPTWNFGLHMNDSNELTFELNNDFPMETLISKLE